MKKIFRLLALVVISLGVAFTTSCGGKEEDNKAASDRLEDSIINTISFSLGDFAHPEALTISRVSSKEDFGRRIEFKIDETHTITFRMANAQLEYLGNDLTNDFENDPLLGDLQSLNVKFDNLLKSKGIDRVK